MVLLWFFSVREKYSQRNTVYYFTQVKTGLWIIPTCLLVIMSKTRWCESMTNILSFGLKVNRSHKLETQGKVTPFPFPENWWLFNKLFFWWPFITVTKGFSAKECATANRATDTVGQRCQLSQDVNTWPLPVSAHQTSQRLYECLCAQNPSGEGACASYHSLSSRAEGGRGRRCGVPRKVIEIWQRECNGKQINSNRLNQQIIKAIKEGE